jgi:hypothetical protein
MIRLAAAPLLSVQVHRAVARRINHDLDQDGSEMLDILRQIPGEGDVQG